MSKNGDILHFERFIDKFKMCEFIYFIEYEILIVPNNTVFLQNLSHQ